VSLVVAVNDVVTADDCFASHALCVWIGAVERAVHQEVSATAVIYGGNMDGYQSVFVQLRVNFCERKFRCDFSEEIWDSYDVL
jgi:hypothetical protein